ncbi:MAG: hypothetical protein V1704_00965 [Candidatus Vogelbacteria bacterium]
MSKNQGFASLALIIIALLVLGGGYWMWKGKAIAPMPTDGSPISIAKNTCVYSQSGELSCGSDLILVISGKEVPYKANTSIKIDPDKIIAVGKVNSEGIFIKGSVVFFCPRPGTYEMNEETSKKAVGNCVATTM